MNIVDEYLDEYCNDRTDFSEEEIRCAICFVM